MPQPKNANTEHMTTFFDETDKKSANAILNDVMTSSNDVMTSVIKIDKEKMIKVIKYISQSEVLTSNIPVRLSELEKEKLEEYVLNTLRKKKLANRNVSINKIMRYAVLYILANHEQEFTQCLLEAFKKEKSFDI